MLTGFNTNIQHKGEVYHVQTEDGGLANPIVTTQIFKAGAVFLSKKTNYKEFSLTSPLPSPDTIKTLMQEQHKNMIRLLVFGKTKTSEKGTRKMCSDQVRDNEKSVLEVSVKQKEVKKAGSIGTAQKMLDDLIDDYLSVK